MQRECSNCFYFLQTGTNELGVIGYCRESPPQCQTGENGRPTVAKFPIVLGSMWCGAHNWNQGILDENIEKILA